jgi:hypothetical protein
VLGTAQQKFFEMAGGSGNKVLSVLYKRQQVEEAIARIFNPSCQEPSSELRMRIKRLLALDRSRGRTLRSKRAEEANFAFFSEEGPGTGADISFSEYEAFALLNGVRIMEHGWVQGAAVSILRRARGDLEKEHARILSESPDELFDQREIRTRARAGDLAVNSTRPAFLTIASKGQRGPDEAQTEPISVCQGLEQATEFLHLVGEASFFELTAAAHRLHQALIRTEPRHRGLRPKRPKVARNRRWTGKTGHNGGRRVSRPSHD